MNTEDPTVVAEKRSIPTDAELDALVLLVRDAARGGCGSHQGCRDLVAKKQRDAARRWFIDRNQPTSPGTPSPSTGEEPR